MHILKKLLCASIICALIPFTAVTAENTGLKMSSPMRAFGPFEQNDVYLFDDTPSSADEKINAAIEYILNEIAENHPLSIDISDFEIPEQMGGVFRNRLRDSIRFDHPELFYLTAYSSYTYREFIEQVFFSSVTVTDGVNEYTEYGYSIRDEENNPDVEEIRRREAIVEAETQNILSLVTDDMSPLEKITTVHDYIIANYSYDHSLSSTTLDTMVMQNTGVCQGYTYLFYHVMQRLNIPCVNIPSDPCGHIWNKVMLDGEWYNIDVTHDDPKHYRAVYDYSSGNKRSHFLLSDEELKSLAVPDEDGDTECLQHVVWNDETVYLATSDAYKTSVYRNISGMTVNKDGNTYCFDKENKLCTLDFDNGTMTPVYEGVKNAIWAVHSSMPYYTPTSFYDSKYSTLVLCKGGIYFNSPDKIYLFDASSNTASVYYEYEGDKDPSNTYFYGLRTIDGEMYAEYSVSPNEDITELIHIDVPDPVEPEPEFPCETEIAAGNGDKVIDVTLNIPEKYVSISTVRVAQYDYNDVFIGFAEPISTENETVKPYQCSSDCKTVKAFIWGADRLYLRPYSTSSDFTFDEIE